MLYNQNKKKADGCGLIISGKQIYKMASEIMEQLNKEDEIYTDLLNLSLYLFDADETLSVIEMAMRLMDHKKVTMHNPFHHFIVPAVLLTTCTKATNGTRIELQTNLVEAIRRSKIVLGGSCGFYGACGAGIGMGIFMSIFTNTTPMSVASWSWGNEATGLCLQEISKIPGPRCCKRVVFITLKTAVPIIQAKLNISLPESKKIQCKYSQQNKECKKELCPFYFNATLQKDEK